MNLSQCDDCGAVGLAGAESCPWCLGSGIRRASDSLIFVRPHLGRAHREGLAIQLRGMLDGSEPLGHLRAASAATRPLFVVPAGGAAAIVDRLDALSVPAFAIPRRQIWRRIPAPFLWMLVAVVFLGGLAAVNSFPVLAWVTPLMAGLLVAGTLEQLRQPLIELPKAQTALPRDVQRAVGSALSRLDPGLARDLLTRLTRLAGLCYTAECRGAEAAGHPAASAEVEGQLRNLLLQASDLMVHLDRLNESIGILEGEGAGAGSPSGAQLDTIVDSVRVREHLVARMEEAITALARAERIAAETPGRAAGEIGAAARAIERHFELHRDAWDEVERALA